MFFWHFGLFEQPFGATPEPRFLYSSPSHAEALASLIHGINSGLGFSSLVGESGSGKTTLLYALRERYAPEGRAAYVDATECDGSEFVRNVLLGFDVPVGATDLNAMSRVFRDMVVREASVGRRVLLLVDDAHTLNTSALDALHRLTDFELPSPSPLHVVLAGEPLLNNILEHPQLASLQERITASARLQPLTREQTLQYIEHRLLAAGSGETQIFTPEATALIAENGRGNPREINRLCLSAMNLACALNHKEVEQTDVREALQNLDTAPVPDEDPYATPFLVNSTNPPSRPQPAKPVTNPTWGSQALAAAPAVVKDESPVTPPAMPEAEPAKAAIPTPPPPPPVVTSDPIRELRSAIRDDAPSFGITHSNPRVARTVRRVLKVTAWLAGIAVCAVGIILLSRMAWTAIVNHRAATQAEAVNDTPPAATTPEPATTKTTKHPRAGRPAPSSLGGTPAASTNPAIGGHTAPSGTQTGSTSPQHHPDLMAEWSSRRENALRIPGMTIIPVPYARYPNAPEVIPATLQFRVEPIYPPDAKAQHLEGLVKIRLHIDRTGHVRTVIVLSGDRRLAKPALAAVRQWVFSPFEENGAPFEGDTTVNLQFVAD